MVRRSVSISYFAADKFDKFPFANEYIEITTEYLRRQVGSLLHTTYLWVKFC